jgi:hypothetical protein
MGHDFYMLTSGAGFDDLRNEFIVLYPSGKKMTGNCIIARNA